MNQPTSTIPNFDLKMLHELAARFGFVVDTRDIYPVMIKGQNAMRYRSHRDALNFISTSASFVSPQRYN